MTGGSITTGEYGVYNNGLEETATTIAVSGGTITSTNQVNTACGIYQAGLGSLTLSGTAVVSGPDAVEVRAGSVQVLDNARLVATMPYTEPASNGNGNSGHGGVALLVSQHTTAQNVAATVSGGTLQGEVAFQEATVETQNDPTKVSGAINGGTILGDVKSEDVDDLIPSTSTARFSDADAEGVAEGYALKEVPNSDPPMYAISQIFVVTYANYDGTALQVTTNFVDDATPAYAGATPTRVDETGAFVYTFSEAWSPAVAETVTETVTYTATYTSTSLAAATWIGGASGDWNVPANWDIGYVPTRATVVTFTNNATVGIAPTVCKCKEIVLDNADVTIGRADPVTGADLNFYKTEGSAVSGTGTLALDTVGMFNQNNAGVITIGTALDIRGDVTFKGVKDGNQHAGSWTITGKTTIADGVTVKCIDDATTTFQGDIDIASGAQVTFQAGYGTGNHGASIVVGSASTVTLAHHVGSPATKLTLDPKTPEPDGTITVSDSKVVTDDAAYEVKKSSADGKTTYEVVLKTFSVIWLAEDGATQLDATNGVPHGTSYASLAAPTPTKDATAACTYTFAGWVPTPAETVTSNATYTASFTETTNKFDVIWVADGAMVASNRVDYGTATSSIQPVDPTKTGDAGSVYTFTGWSPAVAATVTQDATYTAGFSSIYIDPASLELYPNCSNYVHVVGAPEGSTYTYKFAGQVGCDSYALNPPGWSKTEGWAWPYGKQPGGTGTITVTVSNNNAQVAQFVANVTVKDVAAVVDGVEYASADFANALAAAKSGDKVLEMYYYMSSYGKVALAEGESIRWKPADNRGKGSFWTSAATIPATTDAAWYEAVPSKDNVTGVTTITCVNQGVPYVKIDDGTTVTYSTKSFTSMSKAGATYTLLRDMTDQTGGAVSKSGVVLDLNGKKLGLATGIKVAVNSAASLTIRDTSQAGTGEISGGNDSSPLVWVTGGGTATIESGTFVSDGTTAVYTENGTASITGGTFSTTAADKTFLLNCKDSNKETITVTGGSFQGFNPQNNTADGEGTDYVAEGYISVADDPSAGWYTVKPAYTVLWVADGTTLETDENVASNTVPTYNGDTPTKATDAQYTYTFAGAWTPAVGPVVSNTTFTAVFTETLNTYTVTWKNWNGDVLETDENVPYGTTPTYDGETPERTADAAGTYTFTGWNPGVGPIEGETVYIAQFSQAGAKATVISVADSSQTYFGDLASAIAAAQPGDTVRLLEGAELTATIVIAKDLVIDLNGNDIAATGTRALQVKSGNVKITGSGTVSADGAGLPANSSVIRVGDAAANAVAATLVVDTNVVVSSSTCYGVTVFGKNSDGDDATTDVSFDLYGTVSIDTPKVAHGCDAAIAGNGSNGLSPVGVTIHDGATVSSTYSTGVFFPGEGTLAVDGGSVSGTDGIEMRAGTLVVNDGTVTATGSYAAPAANGDGTTGNGGVAVLLSQHTTEKPISATIAGGELVGAKAFVEVDTVASATPSAGVAASITGGTIRGEVETANLETVIPADSEALFTDADADGVADGCCLVETEAGSGLYQVATAKASVISVADGSVEYYADFATAVAQAAAGDTVRLLDDAALASTVAIAKDLVIDLNGKNITATDARALWVKSGTVELTGEGTVSATGTGLGETSSVIRVGDAGTAAAKLTVGKDVTVSTDRSYAISAFGKNAGGIELVVNGTVSSTASGKADAAIAGNGNSGNSPTTITINEGAVVSSTNGAGIFKPDAGTLTIAGGSVTGPTALYVKSGVVNVTGGTLTANGAKAAYQTTGDGALSTGDAIVVDNCDYPNGAPTVTVTGGTIVSQNGQSVASYAKVGLDPVADIIPGTSAAKFSDADADGVAEGYYLVAVEGTSSPVLYEVAPRTSVIGTVVTVADNAVYDGTTQDANLALVVKPTADGTALVLDTDYVAVFATNALVNAGDYNVKVVGIGAWKDETNVTFTVAQRPVTFTGASDEKVYDGSALVKDAFATSDDGLVEGHTATATVTGGQTDVGVSSNVVSAAVIKDANDVDVTANYAITYVDGELTVTPAAITITVAGWNGTYDGTAHLAEVEAVPADATILWSVDGGEWAADTPSIKDVGSKEVRAKASKENYSDALSDVISLTVTKAALSVTAKPKTVTYGEEPANDGVDYSGFVNGETESVLGGTLAYAYTYEQFGNVGSYKITPSGLTSDNYEISFVEGTLTVEAKEVGLEWSPDPATFTYDGTAKVPSATATGLVNNDEIAVTVTGEQTKAGTGYTATATALTGDKAGNYKLPAAATTTFDIEPAAMTITVAGYNGVYDGAAHQASATTVPDDATVTWSTDGGESWSDTVPSVTGVANVAIVAKATLANYAEATATTSLVVTAKAVTFTAAGDTKVYDGTALVKDAFTSDGLVEGHTATATVTGSQTIVGASSNVVSAAVIKDAGDNDVTANYNVTYMDGELKVTAATVDIPAAPGNKVYNGQNQTADVTAPATVEVTNDGGKDAGDYTVTFALKDTANYTWSDGSTTNQVFGWSITQKALKLIAEDKEVAHGAAAPAYSYKVDETDGLVEGDSLATEPTLSCAYAAGDAVGTYTIEISGAVAPNYAITYANGTLTVVSNTFTVIWLADDGTTEIDTTQVEWGETPTHADAEKSDATGKYEYRFAAWTPAPGPVTEATNFVASFTTAIKTPLALTVADEKLDSTAVSAAAKTATVAADLIGAVEGVTVTEASGATVTIDEATATAAFSNLEWNQGVEWTMTAQQTAADDAQTAEYASLPGKFYVKPETQWFTATADSLAAVSDGSDAAVGYTAPEASGEGEMVRVHTKIAVPAGGLPQAPYAGSAKVGFAVLQLENDTAPAYYAFGNGAWTKLSGAEPTEGDHDYLAVYDLAAETPTARYYIDGVALYKAVDGGDDVYALPLGNDVTSLKSISFASKEMVKSDIVAEQDVSYVAAVDTTPYTEIGEALTAAGTAGEKTLALLKTGVALDPAVSLGSGEKLVVDYAKGTFTNETPVVSGVAGYDIKVTEAETVKTYELDPIVYPIEYVLNGGDNDPSNTNEYTVAILPLALADATRTGYRFDGWTNNVSGNAVATSIPVGTIGAVTNVATWTINSYALTINYLYTNGTAAATQFTSNVVYDTAYSVNSPVIAGYTADKLLVSGTMGAAPVTVDVTYTVNRHTVAFVDEDGTVLKAATEYDYGTPADAIAKPETPTKAATAEKVYTFAGWKPAVETVTSNAVYKASYSEADTKAAVITVAQDGTTNTIYVATIADAIAAAGNGDTIQLIGDVSGDATIEKDVTIDLNGNTWTGDVSVAGDVTIVDGSDDADGKLDGSVAVANGGSVEVAGGTVDDGITGAGDVVVSGGTVNDGIDADGKISVSAGTVNGGIEGNGDIAVSGGAVNGCVDAGGKLTITGGTITAAVGADEPAISAGGETTISGGSVSGDVMAVDGADVKISGTAAIEGNVQSNGDGTKIGISGGSVNGTLSESNDGDLSVTGGHFSTDPSDYVAEGYYADGDDTNGYDVKERKSLEGAVITVADATYTGSAQAPAPVVKVDEETLELGKDFVAVYATNDLVNADTYDVTIVAIGAWIGSAETTFTIGKKQVVVKAKDLAVAFRTPVADVVYELEYDGIVDGEDPADVVATAPTASSDYAADSPAGSTFDIAVDVTGAAADNYSFVASETKGVLTVGAAEAPTILGTTSITVAQSTVKLQHVLQTGAKYYTYFTCTDLAKGEWVAAENSRAAESIIPETVTDADGVDHEGTTVKFTGVTDDVRFYQVGYSSVPYAIGDAMGEKPADGEEP